MRKAGPMKSRLERRSKEKEDFLDEIIEERSLKNPQFKEMVDAKVAEHQIKSDLQFRKSVQCKKRLSNLTPEEQYILWCAMTSMVEDVHSPQDQLNKDQWEEAEQLLNALNDMINDRANSNSKT